jgi:beta-lactamase class A
MLPLKRLILLLILMIPNSMNGQELKDVRKDILAILDTVQGSFAVAFEDLTTGSQLLINEREMFHAASTMKTPVMVELFAQVQAGRLALTDSLTIRNEFRSIVDSSVYQLDLKDDSDDSMYKRLGTRCTISELTIQMITVSSNLATNILMDLVGASNVTRRMRSMGATDIQVLRGVEDGKAFERGLNNRTSALDLLIVMRAIGRGAALNTAASQAMMEILLAQKFNDIIPAQLPSSVKVAHKTGSITGVEHDSGIVILPDGRRYVLVVLSKNLHDAGSGKQVLARVSRRIYDFMMEGR